MALAVNKKTLQELLIMKAEADEEVKKFDAKLKEAKKKQADIAEKVAMKEIMEKGEIYRDFAIQYSGLDLNIDDVLKEVLDSLKNGKQVELREKLK